MSCECVYVREWARRNSEDCKMGVIEMVMCLQIWNHIDQGDPVCFKFGTLTQIIRKRNGSRWMCRHICVQHPRGLAENRLGIDSDHSTRINEYVQTTYSRNVTLTPLVSYERKYFGEAKFLIKLKGSFTIYSRYCRQFMNTESPPDVYALCNQCKRIPDNLCLSG